MSMCPLCRHVLYSEAAGRNCPLFSRNFVLSDFSFVLPKGTLSSFLLFSSDISFLGYKLHSDKNPNSPATTVCFRKQETWVWKLGLGAGTV